MPDVAFVRLEKVPQGPCPKGYAPSPPDLAVEVRSPTDRRTDIDDNYRMAGVPLIWWADPDHRSVSVYRTGVFVAELREGDVLDGEDVLPAFSLPVSQIFE